MLLPIPKFIRKWLAILRGGVSPVIIFLSVMLGFTFGIIPGFSGLHAVILAVVLVLNVHIGLFLMTMALGKAACLAGAPALYHVGVRVHDWLSPVLSLLAKIPVIGITDFSRYAVAGGIVVGPIVGAVAGLLMARSVIGFRRQLLKLEEGSERFKKWYSNTWVRILDRILIGKRTKDAQALFSSKAKIIRKAGIALAVIAIVAFGSAVMVVKNGKVKDMAANRLTRANGAEVNIDDLSVGVLTGNAAVKGIQVTDANKPAKNQVQIDELSADASVYNLLLGRVVVDKMVVSNIKFDQPRAQPGKVLPREPDEGLFDPNDFKATPENIAKIEKYLDQAEKVKEWLAKVRKWLPDANDKPEEQCKPIKYLDYLLARADVQPAPRFLARDVLLEGVEVKSAVFGNSTIKVANLNDAPAAAALPIVFDVNSLDTPMKLNVVFDYTSGESIPKVSGRFSGLELAKLGMKDSAGISFAGGTASGTFEGIMTAQNIDMTVMADVNDMQASATGDGILGMGRETTAEAMKVLKDMDLKIRIVGPTDDPRLVFEVEDLQETIKTALLEAGKARLVEEMDKQIDKAIGDKLGDKLGGDLGGQIKNAIKDPNGIMKDLGGFLGGNK